MAVDYLLFVLVVSLGVLQLVAAWGRLEGISFFPRRYLCYIFAAVMVSGGHAWFFGVENRNVPDTAEGLSGPWLFVYAVAAVAISMLLTLVISSAVRARWGRPDSEGVQRGLEVLKRMTYLQALKRGLRRYR